jgi:hypothetical protein
MNIYVTDMADNKAIWKARQEFFTGDFPCSTLVQVASLANPEIKLEITCQAVAGSGQAGGEARCPRSFPHRCRAPWRASPPRSRPASSATPWASSPPASS